MSEPGMVALDHLRGTLAEAYRENRRLAAALAEAERERDEANTILRWIEAGFPPWGCDNCRGAEYGPEGFPCIACNGRSDLIEPPARAQAIFDYIDGHLAAARRETATLREALTYLVRDHLGGCLCRSCAALAAAAPVVVADSPQAEPDAGGGERG